MFTGPLSESLIKKAQEKGLIFLNIHDIRSETQDKHNTADDSPYGGGSGMVMLAEPIIKLLKNVKQSNSKVIYLSPTGKPLNQEMVRQLSKEAHLVLICGHYEGIDERVMPYIDEEVSIGDYVLTGGELPAAVLVDSVCRNLPGVIKEMSSVEEDSFYSSLLDNPHYTRPADFDGSAVPEVLLNGHHEEIRKWRRKIALERTLKRRPDILPKAAINDEDREFLKEIVLGI